jgi:universal stress protein A
MIEFKNVLVATDFSEPSNVALTYGRDLAKAYGATLHVVHVIDDLVAFHGDELGLALADVARNIEAAAREDLADAVASIYDGVLQMRATTLHGRSVAPAIVGYAADHAIDLIVVGTHGHGAVHRFLIGSVAERVMRTAPCPVLTVRALAQPVDAPLETSAAHAASN